MYGSLTDSYIEIHSLFALLLFLLHTWSAQDILKFLLDEFWLFHGNTSYTDEFEQTDTMDSLKR